MKLFYFVIIFTIILGKNTYSHNLIAPFLYIDYSLSQTNDYHNKKNKLTLDNNISQRGCFIVSYAFLKSQKIACTNAAHENNYIHLAKRNREKFTIGNGNNYMLFSGNTKILEATGTFSNYRAYGNYNNAYSIQLNTNNDARTSACEGGSDECTVWQQFVYNSKGYIVIWYWLLNYGDDCPVSWVYYTGNCYRYSNKEIVPNIDPKELGDVAITARVSNRGDTMHLIYKGKTYSLNSSSNLLGIDKVWNAVEFNILGLSYGRKFLFNPKTYMKVNITAVLNKNSNNIICTKYGTTAEKNNLKMGRCIARSITPRIKSLSFVQHN